jgi:hypothetical protein
LNLERNNINALKRTKYLMLTPNPNLEIKKIYLHLLNSWKNYEGKQLHIKMNLGKLD